MKEFKILAVIIALVGITYYGIEPYAHSVMHPEVAAADFTFKDVKNVDTSLAGNAENGKVLVEANCIACHAIESASHPQMMPNADAAAAYGVTPPDLSHAGRIYDKNYLANFIFDPVSAMHLQHKFGPDTGKTFPMPSYNWMTPQEIMDVVAYLQSIAPKVAEGKEGHKVTFEAACGRCHSMKYAGIEATTPTENLKTYMGATPPDLSQHIKSRGEHYLHSFINDPQVLLHGTAMPRVGLTEEAQEEVITYMEEIGDSKKAERETVGLWVMLYSVVFALFAFLWKRKIWEEVH
ncbi:MAG: c-type cytochrome [Sulfuricurvum sp.]|jgi:ubiquinol-cytochrome c reductase cytochrome c1 subunit|uniref:c-type cytochrome n=1 Tax=Sulfuricurvum sp. TaxID=2025608 RepID=UPI0025CF304E|nr:c-type cytochrome [Sulfuricurvum sp.]MCK9374187.1 c-type cytochrome [Sulfuricurvum sp.]